MARARVDTSIQRQTAAAEGGGPAFDFPLGVYPVEPMTPVEGYTLAFESADEGIPLSGHWGTSDQPPAGPGQDEDDDDPSWRGQLRGGNRGGRRADGDADDAAMRELRGFDGEGAGDDEDEPGPDEGELEPWPDRYVFDINIRASRVESLCRQLFAMLPGRVFPILDVMGNDAYREIDPYIAYDLVGLERFLEAVRRFRGWFFEDGMVGFGAMSEDPFIYVFVDEHKIVTVRVPADAKEQVEKTLHAYDLQEVEKIAGADSAVHEHRGVLDAPSNRPDLLTHDEIVEQLRDDWGLTLNVDPFNNNDESANALGVVPWRCLVRVFDEGGEVRYAEVFLTADSLQNASELAVSAAEMLLAGDDPALPLPEISDEDLGLTHGSAEPGAAGAAPTDSPEDLGKTGGKTVDKPEGERTGNQRNTGGSTPPRRRDDDPMAEIPLDDLTLDMEEFDILVADRIRPDDLDQFPLLAAKAPLDLKSSRILAGRWME